jgi:hypothetical protein
MGSITYDAAATEAQVEELKENNVLFKKDIDTILTGPFDVKIEIADKGQSYDWRTNTVKIKINDVESLAHEVHHAAQHAAMGEGPDSATFTRPKGMLALEVSALATGMSAAGGNALRRVSEMLPKYYESVEAYRCEEGPRAALDYAFSKQHMEYSQERMEALEIRKEDIVTFWENIIQNS